MKYFKDYKKEEQDILCGICLDNKGKPAKMQHIDYYLKQCDVKKIDPFSRMAHLTIRWDSRANAERPIFTMGIDGARAIAARSGKLAGSDDIEYDDADGDKPKWARATVWRQVGDERRPFTITLRFKEFKPAPPNDRQWNQMPYHMLGKCAEMAALRKAFPEDLQEVYETAEPHHDDSPTEAKAAPVQPTGVDRWNKTVEAFSKHGIDPFAILERVKKKDPKDVTDEDFTDLYEWYQDLERGEETA